MRMYLRCCHWLLRVGGTIGVALAVSAVIGMGQPLTGSLGRTPELETLARGLEHRQQISGTVHGLVRMKRFLSDFYRQSMQCEVTLPSGEQVKPREGGGNRTLTTVRFLFNNEIPRTWYAELLDFPNEGYDWWGYWNFTGRYSPVRELDRRLISWCDGQREVLYDATGPRALVSAYDGRLPEYLKAIVDGLIYTGDETLIKVLRADNARLSGKVHINGYKAYKVEQRFKSSSNKGYRSIWICPDLSFAVLRYELCSLPANYPERPGTFFVYKYSGFYKAGQELWLPTSCEHQRFRSLGPDKAVWITTGVLETDGLAVEKENSDLPRGEWIVPLGTPIYDDTTGEGRYEGGLSPEFLESFNAEPPPVLEDAQKAFAKIL